MHRFSIYVINAAKTLRPSSIFNFGINDHDVTRDDLCSCEITPKFGGYHHCAVRNPELFARRAICLCNDKVRHIYFGTIRVAIHSSKWERTITPNDIC